MKKIKKSTATTKLKSPKKDRDLPVTKRYLDLRIQKVESDITALRLEMKSGFSKIEMRFKEQDAKFLSIDARFESIDSRFESIDARFESIDSRFESLENRMEARFAALDTKITKMLILFEEQNDRNRIVLDAYTTVYEKFMENDRRLDKVESHIFGVKQK